MSSKAERKVKRSEKNAAGFDAKRAGLTLDAGTDISSSLNADSSFTRVVLEK
jgi:hypothetical protein